MDQTTESNDFPTVYDSAALLLLDSYGFPWTISIFWCCLLFLVISYIFYLCISWKHLDNLLNVINPVRNNDISSSFICNIEIGSEKHIEAVNCAINKIFNQLLQLTTLDPSMCGIGKIIDANDCHFLLEKVTLKHNSHPRLIIQSLFVSRIHTSKI